MLSQILKTLSLKKQIPIPPLEYFFEDLDKVEHIPFTLTWEEAKDKPFCVLHTSGSTGIPKPVFVTYGTFACNDAHQLIPSLGGKPTLVNFLKGKRYFLALPLFHAACLTFAIGYNIFAGVTSVIPPAEPLNADLMNEVYKYGNLDGALLAPALIVDCFNNPQYYETMLSNIKFLSYVGGALPAEVGDEVSKRIKLMTLMGSCETALHPLEITDDPADWSYLAISESLGHSFVEHEESGYHELVIKRSPEHAIFQGVFSTFPEKQSFNSGDLFERHLTNPNAWAFRARTDDIIAFTTAEKLNPITMESTISTNPNVKSALIGGQGKFQASLLIEPHVYPQTEEEKEQLFKDIWPTVLEANRACPAFGRIMKQFIILSNPDKPIPRAGKGTVQRQGALQLYKAEFEELYERIQPTVVKAAASEEAVTAVVPEAAAPEPVVSTKPEANLQELDMRIEKALAKLLPGFLDAAIQKAFSHMLVGLTGGPADSQSTPKPRVDRNCINGTSGKTSNGTVPPIKHIRALIYQELAENLDTYNLTDDTDLFDAGLDSLQVKSLVHVLNGYLIKKHPNVGELQAKLVYERPTVREILEMIDV
jgi:acyl-CoA synthetase (AMP-forming)/AMP-acid ligase II/aryl carrier-like protein